MFKTLVIIGIGGSLGSISRYLTSILIERYYTSFFPWATLIVNILGCFLIGLAIGYLEKHQMTNDNIKWFFVTGFCGGFTTFSAFGVENIRLFQNGNFPMAVLYIGSSVILGLASVWLGLALAK